MPNGEITTLCLRAGKIRVWQNTLPDAGISLVHAIHGTIANPCSDDSGLWTAAGVEMHRHTGGMIKYVMLGATCFRNTAQALEIVVASSEKDVGLPYASDIVPTGDNAFLALPNDYCTAVFDAACSFERTRLLGCGRLVFDRAAHAIIGSSRHEFTIATRFIVSLLTLPSFPVTEATIFDTLQREYRHRLS